MEEYLRRIVQSLERAYGSPGVQVDLAVTDEVLGAPRLTLVGLIVTELLSNALTHAFPSGEGGRIEIRFGRTGDRYVLRVADTGIGMESTIPTFPSALGLRLVQLYAQRLRARVTIEVAGGTRVTLTFPVQDVGEGESSLRRTA
jgi:two-component sensor histidine kinase